MMIYSELKFVIISFVLFSLFVSNQVMGEQLTKQVQTIIKEDGLNAGKGFLLQKVYDGEIEAVHLLASILIRSKNITGNLELAVKVLERGSELGDAKSSFLLGNYYSDNNFVKPNIPVALHHFELAKKLGHPNAEQAISKITENFKSDLPKTSSKKDKKSAPPQLSEANVSPPGYFQEKIQWKADIIDLNSVVGAGSGFTISPNGLIVTNEHVIENCEKIFAVYQGRPKKANLLYADKAADFATINIGVDTPSFFHLKLNEPELGEELISGGFPSPEDFGFGIKITTGVVSEERSEIGTLFQHSTPIQPGNSGGPLINKNGALVGISTAISTVKFDNGNLSAQNVNYAVSNLTAKHFLKKWSLPFFTYGGAFKFDSVTLSRHLKKAAVQILCY